MRPFLFKLNEEEQLLHREYPSLTYWLREEFVRRKLESPFGYLLLCSLAMVFAWQIGTYGWVSGAIWLVALQFIPLLLAAMFNLRFGLYLSIFSAFILMGLKKITGNLPLGIFLDASILFMIFGLYLRQIRRRDWRATFHIFTVGIVAWLSFNFIQLFNPNSPSQVAWLYEVRDTALRMMFFFVPLYALTRLDQLERVAKFWILLTSLGALYAIIQEIFGLMPFEEIWIIQQVEEFERLMLDGKVRNFSFFSTPGIMGMLMAGTSVFCLPLFFLPGLRRWEKGVLAVCVALMWMAMFLSGTRTAFVVLPLGFLFLLTLSFDKKLIPFGIAIFAFGVILFFVPLDNPNLQRYRSTFRPSAANSLQERLQNQEYIKPYIQAHPMGGGLGITGKRGQQFSPFKLISEFRPKGGYVQVAIEMGWIGLLLYLGLLFMVMYVGVRNYFKMRNLRLRTWILAFLGGLFVLIIGNYSQNPLMNLPSSLFFYLGMAAIVLLRRFDNKNLAFDPFKW